MAALFLAAGALLVLTSWVDAVATTIRVTRRGGPLSRLISGWLWAGFRRVASWSGPAVLQFAGTTITTSIVLSWVVTLLGGWFLLFSASPEAVLNTSDGSPAGGWSRLYFVALTAFTVGAKELSAGGGGWRAAEAVAGGSGLLLITLAITYLMPLTAAVTRKRQVARLVSALGKSPSEIISKGWRDGNFQWLQHQVVSVTPVIAHLAEEHLSYPMLHYYRAGARATAFGPSVAALDEALLVLGEGVAERVALPPVVVEPARDAVDGLLGSLPAPFEQRAEEPPAPPDLSPLGPEGIPLRADDEIATLFAKAADHRRRLRSLVEHEGWDWEVVYQPELAARE